MMVNLDCFESTPAAGCGLGQEGYAMFMQAMGGGGVDTDGWGLDLAQALEACDVFGVCPPGQSSIGVIVTVTGGCAGE